MGNGYDEDYFRWMDGQSERAARAMLPVVFDLVHPDSVVDVGCGTGAWLRVAHELGATPCVGIDGSYARPPSARPWTFVAHDLRDGIPEVGRHDLAICLEVADALPPEAGPGMVAQLAALAGAVMFSAAVPGQPDRRPKQNPRWPAYWAELFARHGMVARDELRLRFWHDDRVSWWYAQNTILYVAAEPGWSPSPPPPALVHPDLYASARAASRGSLRRSLVHLAGQARGLRRRRSQSNGQAPPED